MQGAAVGGGLGLALAADFRVATPETRFSCNFAKLGFHQGFGISVTLPAVVGQQRALELMYTGGRRAGRGGARASGSPTASSPPTSCAPPRTAFASEIAASAPLAVLAIRETMRGDLAERVRAATAREHERAAAPARHRRLPRRRRGDGRAPPAAASPGAVGGDRTHAPTGIDLDVVRALGRGARARSSAPPFTAEQIAGGQSNITVRLTDADGREFVVRRPPLHSVLATAHDMGREHRIIHALGPTPVPVPEALGVLRRRRRDRRAVLRDGVRRRHRAQRRRHRRARSSTSRRARHAGESLVDALVALHAVDVDAVGLGDLAATRRLIAPPAQALARAVRGDEDRATCPAVDRVHELLAGAHPGAAREHDRARRLPARQLHRRRPTATSCAVLDWEICTLGDPLADVGYVLATWAEPGDPLRADDHNPTLAPGFATRDALLERYAARSGRDVAASSTTSRSRSGGSRASSRACWPASSPARGATPTPTSTPSAAGWRVARSSRRNTLRVSDRRPKGARRAHAQHRPSPIAGYSHVAVIGRRPRRRRHLLLRRPRLRAAPPRLRSPDRGRLAPARHRPGAPRRRSRRWAPRTGFPHLALHVPADAWDDTMDELDGAGCRVHAGHRAPAKTSASRCAPRSSRIPPATPSSSPTSIPPEPTHALVSVGARLSERTLLTLFLIPVTVLAVAGIVANAIFPTLVADAPALVPALTTRADRLLLVVPLVPGELFLSVALIRELIGDPLFYLFGRRYGDVGIRWIERRSGPDARWFAHGSSGSSAAPRTWWSRCGRSTSCACWRARRRCGRSRSSR